MGLDIKKSLHNFIQRLLVVSFILLFLPQNQLSD